MVELNGARLPVEHAEIETTDVALAHEYVSSGYVEHSFRLRTPSSNFVFRAGWTIAGDLSVDELTYRATSECGSVPFESVTVAVFGAGRYAMRRGRDETRFEAGNTMLFPTDRDFGVYTDMVEVQVVKFPLHTVTRSVARMGVDPAGFRFDELRPVSPAMNQHWIATAAYVHQAFAGPDPVVAHPLVNTATQEALAAAAIAVFPNATMTLDYTRGPGRVPPATVRRAMAYIDAHAGEPITIEDVAEAAGIGVRGLQAGFARHHDTTPMGYLRRVRLEQAHRDLQAADPARGDTVAGIARRWGFANAGRFAADYRTTYGRPPGHTLRT